MPRTLCKISKLFQFGCKKTVNKPRKNKIEHFNGMKNNYLIAKSLSILNPDREMMFGATEKSLINDIKPGYRYHIFSGKRPEII